MKIIPTRKVASGVIAGAIVTIIAGLVRHIWSVEITGEEGAAYSVICTFIVQWLVPERLEAND